MNLGVVPFPCRVRESAAATLGGGALVVSAPGMEAVVGRAAALARRAFGIELTTGAEGDAVVVGLGGHSGPQETSGRDPRPADRAGVREAHRIRALRDGRIEIAVDGEEGLFRALTTLAGILGVRGSTTLPSEIDDAPRFSWRGLSLDVVRRWFPREEIERIIDLLALLKLNVLHLHLTDAQGWRFPVAGYPELTAEAPHYSREDLDALVAYARERYVTLIPEIDLPGHTAAVAAALPHLAPGPFPHPYVSYVDLDTPGVEEFVTAAIGELVARFDSPYVHIGGDEAFGMPHGAYVASVERVAAMVRASGRTPVAWQEASRASGWSSSDVLQLWVADRDRFDLDTAKQTFPVAYHALLEIAAPLFAEAVGDPARAAAQGVPFIVSSSDPLYLDRKPSEPSLLTGQNERRAVLGHPGYEPTPSVSALTWDPASQHDIVESGAVVDGLEAALWCETVESFDDVAQLLLPRLAFVAQKAWGEATLDDVVAAAREQSVAWERLGFGAYYRSTDVFR